MLGELIAPEPVQRPPATASAEAVGVLDRGAGCRCRRHDRDDTLAGHDRRRARCSRHRAVRASSDRLLALVAALAVRAPRCVPRRGPFRRGGSHPRADQGSRTGPSSSTGGSSRRWSCRSGRSGRDRRGARPSRRSGVAPRARTTMAASAGGVRGHRVHDGRRLRGSRAAGDARRTSGGFRRRRVRPTDRRVGRRLGPGTTEGHPYVSLTRGSARSWWWTGARRPMPSRSRSTSWTTCSGRSSSSCRSRTSSSRSPWRMGTNGTRFRFVGVDPDSGGSIEGEVTVVVTPSGQGSSSSAWRPRANSRFVDGDLHTMIDTARVG